MKTRLPSPATGTPSRPAARRRLGLEALEARDVPATFTVTSLLDDDSSGTLRWAVGRANATAGADDIVFAPAVAGGTIVLNPTRGDLELTDAATTTIDGGTAGATIDGDNATRLILVKAGASAELKRLTLVRGRADFGAAISNSGTLTVANGTLAANAATAGGGAVYNTGTGTLSLVSSTVAGNTAQKGGAVYSNQGKLTVTASTVVGNATTGIGGALVGGLFVMDLTSSLVLGNTSSSGGQEVVGDYAATGGTLVGLPAGSALRDVVLVGANGKPLLADNGGPTKTIALVPGSPAIGAGPFAAAGATVDQRGYSRPAAGPIDIGAYQTTAMPREVPSLIVTTVADVQNSYDGLTSLREAVAYANARAGADTITFAPAVAGGTIVLANEFRLTDAATTTIDGGTAGVTIDGNRATHLFTVNGGASAAMNALTLTGGVSIAGAGIYNSGMLAVTNSTLSNNTATFAVGGGIYNSGTLTVKDSTLSNNTADGSGGGIANYGQLAVVRSTFTGNTATGFGGGILNYGEVTVEHSTFSNNSARIGGGAIYSDFGELTVAGSTLANNSAAFGGSIDNIGTATLVNTILTDGVSGSLAAASANNLLVGSGSVGGLSDGVNGNIVVPTVAATGLDPAGRADNGGPTKTIALLAGSPAIDAGNDALVPAGLATDQRGAGFGRFVRTVDIGAFEVQNVAPTDIALSNATVAENAGANAVVGTLTASDPDAGDTFTFSLPAGLGDNAAFHLDGNTLRANAGFDFEARSSYAVTVRVADAGGLSYEEQFTITVTNVNEAPTVTSGTTFAVPENTAAVTTVTAPDPDAGTTLTYGIAGGSDAAQFALDSSTGVLTFLTPPNFEAPTDANGDGVYEVAVAASDGDLTGTQLLRVTVTNVNEAPTVGGNAPSVTVAEGSPATASGTFADPEGRGTVTLTASVGTVVKDDATGTWSWTYTPVDDTSTPVTITAEDELGLTAATTFALTATNVAPTASAAGPTVGVRYQPRTFTFSATDPSSADAAPGFTYTVNWGDWTPAQTVMAAPGNGGGVALDHAYAATGTYTVTVTTRDKNGGGSQTTTRTITIVAAAILDDPLNPGQKALFVGGTSGADEIEVERKGNDRYEVEIEGGGCRDEYEREFRGPVGRVVVYAGAGNDEVEIGGNVRVPVFIFGGDGNDELKGGENAPNVLVGGAGNDELKGGSLRDILIGGAGADGLDGKSGDDLLIGGSTAFDLSESALWGVQLEWTSDRTYEQRVANLRGTGGGRRPDGDAFLVASGSGKTVYDDGAADRFKGGSGRDWYFGRRLGGVRDRFDGLAGNEFADEVG